MTDETNDFTPEELDELWSFEDPDFDPEKASRFEPADGKYVFQILDVQPERSKAGNAMISYALKVLRVEELKDPSEDPNAYIDNEFIKRSMFHSEIPKQIVAREFFKLGLGNIAQAADKKAAFFGALDRLRGAKVLGTIKTKNDFVNVDFHEIIQ